MGRGFVMLFLRPDNIWCKYVDERGRIREVLSTCETLLSKRDVDYCVRDQAAFDKMVRNARFPPSKLRYFNFYNDEIVLNVKPFTAVSFSHPDESVRGMSGFSVPEKWGVWSTANRCAFSVNLPKAREGWKLVLKAKAFFGVKEFAVFADDRKLAGWQITEKPLNAADYEFEVPADFTGRLIRLEFRQREVMSPKKIRKSSRDTRMLGLGFISLLMKER